MRKCSAAIDGSVVTDSNANAINAAEPSLRQDRIGLESQEFKAQHQGNMSCQTRISKELKKDKNERDSEKSFFFLSSEDIFFHNIMFCAETVPNSTL